MFDKREGFGFGLMAVFITILNIVFWLALLLGTIYILKETGVINT